MEKFFKIENLSKSFKGIQAVNDFSISIEKGSIVGLIGPNGAGKTTLFNLITGFLPTEKGRILYKNKNICKKPPYKIANSGIVRTFQELRLILRLSVMDNMLLAISCRNSDSLFDTVFNRRKIDKIEKTNKIKCAEILNLVGLEKKQNYLTHELSYGQQKLLSLACSLAKGGELFLFDEPVSGVNQLRIEAIKSLMKKMINFGKTILFIEHNIDVVKEISDQTIVMDHGRLIAKGTPISVLENQDILKAYLE